MPKTITWIQEGSVALLTLRYSPVNALHSSVLTEIEDCLHQIEAGQRTRAVVLLSSSDKVFATTYAQLNSPSTEELRCLRQFQQLLQHIKEFPFPILAIIAGAALGAGFELALACDLRISGEYAKFGFPDTPNGILPTSIGVTTLVEEVGVAKTKELLWGGRLIGAKEAHGLGIVNAVIPDSHLVEEGIAMAHSLASLPEVIVEAGKRLGEKKRLVT
ncbi:MAG: enoyl-CoA hydratase [Brevibacillus sp.]|nr:enoyl-CoA hydratase [Brevibacillus sp.]